jgi:dihydropteridine reductase
MNALVIVCICLMYGIEGKDAFPSEIRRHQLSVLLTRSLSVLSLPCYHIYQLDGFISLPQTASLSDLTVDLVRGVHSFLHGQQQHTHTHDEDEEHQSPSTMPGLDAIVVASGGWTNDPKDESSRGDNSLSAIEQHATAFSTTIEEMRRKNLDPCVASGYIAQRFMNPSGLFVVLGATAALQPTPGMVGYGLAKAGAHFYVQTLGACTGQSLESKSIRKEGAKARTRNMDSLSAMAILPTTIDTAANRRAFPNGDYKEWVRPLDIAKEIATWVHEPSLRPHSGSLVKVRATENQQGASFELAR